MSDIGNYTFDLPRNATIKLTDGEHEVTIPAGTELRAEILDYIGRLQQGKREAEERAQIAKWKLMNVRAIATANEYVDVLAVIGESDG